MGHSFYSRLRKKPLADRCKRPHRQGQCSRCPHNNCTSSVSGCLPISAASASCGKGNRLACAPAAASLCWGYFPCVPSVLLSATVLLEKASCTIPAAYSGVGTLLITSGQLVPKLPLNKVSRSWLLVVLPQPRYSFSDGHLVFKVLSIEELI